MSYSIEDIVGIDSFSAESIAAIQAALATDESLRLAVSRWISVSKSVRQSIENDFPSSEALVCFALRHTLSTVDLTEKERETLQRVELEMETSIANHPAIGKIITRIQNDATAFEAAWDAAFESARVTPISSVDRAPVVRRFTGMRLVRMAVSTAAVVFLIAFGISRFNSNPELPSHAIEYAAGQSNQFTLEDGSSVRLTAGSKLSWDGAFSRSVVLSGSAFFDVDASSEPFVIKTDIGTTTVLGTSFGVRNIQNGENGESMVQVTLVSGRVSLSVDGIESTVLSPGQQGIISASGIKVESVNLTESLTWTELLVFRDTPMNEVVREIERRFEIEVKLDKSLSNTPLTGTFDQERGAQEILGIIAAAIGAELSVHEQTGAFSLERTESAGL